MSVSVFQPQRLERSRRKGHAGYFLPLLSLETAAPPVTVRLLFDVLVHLKHIGSAAGLADDSCGERIVLIVTAVNRNAVIGTVLFLPLKLKPDTVPGILVHDCRKAVLCVIRERASCSDKGKSGTGQGKRGESD